MGSVRQVVVVAALFLTPAAAHAQCGDQPGGISGLIDTLLDLFRSKKIKFDGSSPGGVSYSGEIEVKDVACGSTTLNVRLTAAAQAKADGKKGPVGGGIDVRAGTAVEYELTLPDKDWATTNAPPNPLDPASLPPGGSMVFRREYFQSLGLEAQYKALVASAGYEEGAGVVVAVQRGEDGKTRLVVGPYTVVKNEMMVGIGKGDFKIGVGRDDKLENGKLKSWTFDPSSPEDVAAYQSAVGQSIAVGSVPLTNRPSDTIEYATYESQTGIRISGGPVSFGGNFGQAGSDLRFVTRPDGTVTATASNNFNGTILEQVRQYESAPPNGRQIGQDEITLSITEPGGHDYLAQAIGEKVGPGGFKIKLTNENWQEWRDRARRYLDAHPDQAGRFPLEDLANATGPMDVAQTLWLVTTNPMTNDELPILLATIEDPSKGPLPGAAGKACPNATDEPADDAETRATELASRWCGSNMSLFAATTSVALPVRPSAGPANGAGIYRD